MPGSSTSHAPEVLECFPDITTMTECTGGMPGVPKTDIITYSMHSKLYVHLLDNSIYFYEDMQSLCHKPEVMKKKLLDQLRGFVFDIKEVRHDLDRVKVKLTGKKGGAQDDLLVATMMIPYWRLFFLSSERTPYKTFKETYLYHLI